MLIISKRYAIFFGFPWVFWAAQAVWQIVCDFRFLLRSWGVISWRSAFWTHVGTSHIGAHRGGLAAQSQLFSQWAWNMWSVIPQYHQCRGSKGLAAEAEENDFLQQWNYLVDECSSKLQSTVWRTKCVILILNDFFLFHRPTWTWYFWQPWGGKR